MKELVTFLVTLTLLSGCSSLNLGRTVAGGANGVVDYCVMFGNSCIIGVKAERKGDPDKED